MKMADFKTSLSRAAPAPQLGAPLAALWWAAKGNWDEAHKIAQDQHTPDSAWVHAYLHRVEGDLGNAGYWCAPCKGGAFQWVKIPPGNRSSRKQSEQSWR